jgi:hypothetical protein
MWRRKPYFGCGYQLIANFTITFYSRHLPIVLPGMEVAIPI